MDLKQVTHPKFSIGDQVQDERDHRDGTVKKIEPSERYWFLYRISLKKIKHQKNGIRWVPETFLKGNHRHGEDKAN
jgi:hypothetical protein